MTDVQLKIVDGPDVGREFPIGGSLVIGRDPSAGIVLEDSEVSRRHATVSSTGGSATVEDLGSTNGTFVNGERIEGTRTLSAGDRLRIGTTVLEVKQPVQATMIAQVPEPEDPGATQMASVMSPEEAERAVKAEEAMRHGEPEGADEDDTATVVPDDGPSPPTSEQPPAAAPPPAPEPPAPTPPTPAAPQSPAPGPQSPAPGPQAPLPGPQAPQSPPPPPAPPAGAPVPAAQAFGAPPQAPLPQPGVGQPPVGYQAGPGFQVRNPGAQWALCVLVPFYVFIWYYRLCTEIGEWSQGRIHTNPGTSLLAISLGGFVIVPPWVSLIGTMGRVRQCQQMAGLQPTVSFGGWFGRALLFGYGYKWLTEQLNELAVRRPVQ